MYNVAASVELDLGYVAHDYGHELLVPLLDLNLFHDAVFLVLVVLIHFKATIDFQKKVNHLMAEKPMHP